MTINAQKLSVYDLQCEHKIDPIGIDLKTPRLSWKISASDRGVSQTAYQIRVAHKSDFAKGNIVWESGKVASDASVLVPYQGPAIEAGFRYYWQVKIWDNRKRESSWSKTAYWETGLALTDWKAKWIEPAQDTSLRKISALLRKEFTASKAVRQVRAYVTAHGLYEMKINGQPVTDFVLMPGWTSYNNRLQYQVYDVTPLLKTGSNAIGVMLGEGWYKGTLGWESNTGFYGKRLGLLCQLRLTYEDGSEEFIVTDGTWKSFADGPVVVNGIYDGESYDARKELKDWDRPGFRADQWATVQEVDYGYQNLVAMETVPVKRIEELPAKKLLRTPKGINVIDFGQNLVGWVRLKVTGPAGTTVTIRHAEVLDKNGEFYTENLRKATATLKYTLKGSGEEIYEPHFTFFGFRYISIEGYPGDINPANFTAVVVHSEMKPTGTFECSDTLVNQLQRNIRWGQKGNFVDVPTDCPQRDERLGWTGDAQAFCRTAAFNMDVSAFFKKWLKGLAADQKKDGSVPYVIPNVLDWGSAQASTGWADAATIIPYTMYQVYADKEFLEQQYNSMKAWVGYMENTSRDGLWNSGFHFGDWLFFSPTDDTDGRAAVTDKYMIAQCFWAHSTDLVARTARILGKTQDAERYEESAAKIRAAYLQEYVTPAGRLISDTQTAYVLALHFDMLPENLRQQAADRLASNIGGYENHLTTGFLGTPYLCEVLTRFGYNDLAYTLLLQKTYPSWLYPVTMGATTIWERWDGIKPDGSFQNVGMNSFNHYAYGAIGDWLYRVVTGIEIGAPGYKKVMIQPQPGGKLTSARASFESAYGLIASGWEVKNGGLIVSVTIPANTTATITLPDAELSAVLEGTGAVASQPEFKNARQDGSRVVLETGSGTYVFRYGVKGAQ
jgi:alpha-L-rhamnosidase